MSGWLPVRSPDQSTVLSVRVFLRVRQTIAAGPVALVGTTKMEACAIWILVQLGKSLRVLPSFVSPIPSRSVVRFASARSSQAYDGEDRSGTVLTARKREAPALLPAPAH